MENCPLMSPRGIFQSDYKVPTQFCMAVTFSWWAEVPCGKVLTVMSFTSKMPFVFLSVSFFLALCSAL